MRLALIAPPHLMHLIDRAYLGYHMCLSQEAHRNSEYADFYRHLSKKGHFVILDNGAAEPKAERITWNEVLNVASYIEPSEIVMPDVLENAMRTVELTVQEANFARIPVHKRMIVPQGNSFEEWIVCLDTIATKCDFRTIGIPKHMEHKCGRVMLLNWLVANNWHCRHDIHLLGLAKHPEEEVTNALRAYWHIRGIDTGAPIAYAQEHKTLQSSERASLDWKRSVDSSLAMHNINVLERWCNGDAA